MTIKHTLDSVFYQTLDDYEHLIIDGKSTDSTLSIIKAHMSKNIKLVSEPDNGIYDAMNKGLAISRGKYVAILNSDDYFADSNVLENLNDIFLKTGSDIVYSSIKFVNNYNEPFAEWRPSKFKKGIYRFGFHVPHPGFFAKLELYKALGNFDTNMSIAADFDLMFRFMENEDTKCAMLDQVTVKMRADGASSSLMSVIQGHKDIAYSFKKNRIKLQPVLFYFRRYLPKLWRKIKKQKQTRGNYE